MAKRRCISIDLYESRAFLDLSDKAKNLYISLILHSDDEGIVINPDISLCILKATKDNLEELVNKGFLLETDGIYIIKHWYLHNKVQPSKMSPSLYQAQLGKLKVNERKEYEFS